ncbi:MAG: M20/M25/M40 family metallo-hydrolase [Ardenticatenaceae bacterium]|nr:M20/M25/M40 family metallo-hydrolase [Anaerolineales bacterium]MCB8979228.1 M20/M25/M40 family metallo-hydrolase [Ardenticatenaceae bacterium]
MPDPTIYQRPSELLQHLIRFNTTNPPGNELACVQYINGLLQAAGIETTLLAKEENRPNLIARIPGSGNAPPLLMQGHVDVVTTADQQWPHDPFGGELIDGMIWGRGALDMKGGVAMMVAAFLKAQLEGITPPGDLILTILSDEEVGGDFGAKFLVQEHPEQFENVQFAIGEFGGFTMQLAGQTFYPIMVAEKQICSLKLTLRGPGGHGSSPIQGGAMAKLGQILTKLDQNRLPVHITPEVRAMYEAIAANVAFPTSLILRLLLNPSLTNLTLGVLGPMRQQFDALLRHTVSPTLVQGGHKINVIPSEVSLQLDGRLLPGYQPKDLINELHTLLGNEVEIEMFHHDPGPPAANMALFDTLADILRRADPNGVPIPLVLPAVTDARHFARLGIQTYGFLPMQLPPDFNFSATIHAAEERIPAAALDFGTAAIFELLTRFG